MVTIDHGDVSAQPWKTLQCDEKQYLVKYLFDHHSTSYDILVYKEDDATMWREMSDNSMFENRWKEYNPNIESNSSTSLGHVQQSLEKYWRFSEGGHGLGGESSSIKVVVEKEVVKLVVKSKLKAGIPFSWSFVCIKCKENQVKELLVDPLFGMVKELARQRQQLFSIIEKKDREIEDYKDQGSVPSRRNLVTVPFFADSFLKRNANDEEFLRNCLCGSKETLALPDVQELYQSVICCRKNEESSVLSRPDVNVATQPPSETKHMNTVTVDNIGPAGIPSSRETKIEEPVSEPAGSNDEIEPIETEMERREKIRKRLEEEEERKKKKKRKIKI